jgi:hypothetical protein
MNAVEIYVKPDSSTPAKVAQCAKINECSKIKVILDHDLMDFQYAEIIRHVCRRCN